MTASGLAARELATRARTTARPSLVLGLAIPLVFLHRNYQPDVTLDVGPASLDVFLSDLAILAVVVAAVVVAARDGLGSLAAARRLWLLAGAFLAWLVLSVVYGRLLANGYPFTTHLVSAAKFVEYALLAPAAVMLLREVEDVVLALAAVVGWSLFMSLIALLQFLGLVDEFEGRRPGQREPSYLGIHDFAAFSGAALALALVAIAWPRVRRRAVAVGGVTGALGIVLAASIYAVGGLIASALGVGLLVRRRLGLDRRRALALAGVCVVVTAGAFSLRGSATEAFLRFLGIKPQTRQTTENVQSWSQRLMLGYIGVRIFVDHPVLGVGFQGSQDRFAYGPQLAQAHARFPNQPAQAFPSDAHPWGVQNGPIQALADMGVIGFALLAGTVIASLVLAGRLALRAPPMLARLGLVAFGWILFAVAAISGVGLYAGIPSDALLWLGIGLAGALAAMDARAAG
ncbi:MAG TPA: O-antigen ligase family protein [Gaiellaceae bacterium]|nr:O-antigen ligase family protein [Gaiellaceae bacterium]